MRYAHSAPLLLSRKGHEDGDRQIPDSPGGQDDFALAQHAICLFGSAGVACCRGSRTQDTLNLKRARPLKGCGIPDSKDAAEPSRSIARIADVPGNLKIPII